MPQVADGLPTFTGVFAALIAAVNSRIPEIGALLLKRIRVAHHTLALELLHRLLENPSDDGVQLAVAFLTDCGVVLQDLSPRALAAAFDRLRDAKFGGHPAIRPELDLLQDDQQITNDVSLEDHVDPELGRNVFKFDPDFAIHESQEEEEEETSTGSESESDESGEEVEEDLKIKDRTETDAVELRRTIYLTIMNSARLEELGHKLLSLNIEPGQEIEICRMLVEASAQEKSYNRMYGLLGQQLSIKLR
ncbi:unnamed protein product [Linum tenue]|uniref:MI domain-containing protein n=1 Tax=Linum tenue TaxID=586396 RepID=A0AAV0HVF5_9ROSI|nr:unnamed protein product [Linum tenue]CAI0469980.1 unnamed protein product [Linum tenue]